MKRKTILTVITALILGLSTFCHAQTGSEKEEMKQKKEMKCPMHPRMEMGSMMGKKVIATSDGGIVVMICNKLYKYDKDLNLKKEVEVPLDIDHMKKMRMKMKEMGMMEEMQKK